MRVKQLNEGLEQIAYMLDRNGKCYKGVKDKHFKFIHPFIIMPSSDSMDELVNATIRSIDDFVWYYSHTSDNTIKNKIRENMLFIWYADNKVIEDNFPDSSYFDVDEISYEQFINNHIDIAMGLSQEFLPCRYGGEYQPDGEYGNIYFRITSTGFNWFNIIWKFVYENKHFINTVTIERDESRTGSHEIYRHGGHVFNHMSIDEFIMLQGNPVIESLDIKIGDRFIYQNHVYNKLSEGLFPHEVIKGNPINKIKLFKVVQQMEKFDI